MILDVQKYLELTTIHGLFYTSRRFHLAEKFFWIIALIFSAVCTSVLIIKLAIKVNSFPIVVYMSDQPVSVNEIHFPAVTYCPQFMLHPFIAEKIKNRIYEFYSYEKHTSLYYFYEDEEFLELIHDEMRIGKLDFFDIFNIGQSKKFGYFSYSRVVNQIENGTLKPNELGLNILKRLQVIDWLSNRGIFSKLNFSISADDFLDILNEFPKVLHERIFTIDWLGEEGAFLSEIITKHGLCFTFNMAFSHDTFNLNTTSNDFHYQLHRKNYYGREDIQPPQNLPRKTHTWFPSGLSMKAQNDIEHANKIDLNKNDGILVMLHEPFELPSVNSKSFILTHDRIIDVFIEPEMKSIDDSIHDYTPEVRNCYLEDERKLNFFKVYTRNNCETECQSDFVLDRCGCVEFFMIRNSTVKICSASERNCTQNAQSIFLELKTEHCRCLERCNYVDYNFELIERGVGGIQNFIRIASRVFFDSSEKQIISNVNFKKHLFNESIRKKQFNMLDFLSFVGGVFGLFAGFSALSFVELIYWFAIRPIFRKSRSSSLVHPFSKGPKVPDYKNNSRRNRHLLAYIFESSIHGLQYVNGSEIFDSICWIFFVLSSLSICIHMILQTREKIPNNRIVAYDDNLKFDETVIFPAVTVVPSTATPQYQRTFRSLAKKRRYVSNTRLCNTNTVYLIGPVYKELDLFEFMREFSKIDWFRMQTASFNKFWQPEFSEVLTTRGKGFAFNMINAEEMFNINQIDKEYGYTRNVTMSRASYLKQFPNSTKFPLKFHPKDRTLLTFKLLKPFSSTQICILPSFLIHDPDHHPIFFERNKFIHFGYGMTLNIEVTPEIVRTDVGLKKLSPAARVCYFEGERSLKYFKKYSQKNCENECVANATFGACRCSFLTERYKKGRNISAKTCLNNRDWIGYYFHCLPEKISQLNDDEKFSPESNCSCLPLCNSISYNLKYTSELNTGNETELNVRMNMDGIVLFRRYQQSTSSDIVSYVGGLLGLFVGISMLTLVELFYFITLRVGSDVWRKLRNKNSQY